MEDYKKRKKIQMDYQQCTEHSGTEDGAQPLTNPECVRKSSKDVNRGLYPQPSLKGQRYMQCEQYKSNMPQSRGPQFYSSLQNVHNFETSSEYSLHTSEMSSPKRKLPEEFTSLAKLKIISPLSSSKANFSSSRLSSKCEYESQHDAWRSSEDVSKSAAGCSKMTKATNCNSSTSGESVQPVRKNLFNNEMGIRLPSASNDPNLLAFEEDSTDEDLMIRASVEAEKRCSTSSLDTNLEAFENDSFLDNLSPTMLENMEIEKYESNTFGLLGGSDYVDNANEPRENEDVEYLTCLPDEILEKIFSYLSISVCCNICVVCKRWSRIILNHKFLPWKKLYQRYKYSEKSGVSAVEDIYTTRSFENPKSCLLTLIRYMSEFKTTDQSSNVSYMSRHSMFQVSCDLLKERAPDLVAEGVLSGCVNRVKYKKKLYPNLKLYNVVCMLEESIATSFKKKNMALYVRAKLIVKTIKNFMASDDDCLMLHHVPEKEKEEGIRGASKRINPERRKNLLMEAKTLWERMRNPSDNEAFVTHDAYLKLFQLTEPKLPSVDCILIDEAQDLTPAQQDILMRQDCAKIMVGDPHQQIYSFRGATNALQNIPAAKTFHLTQSFRFGPEIAYVATCVLHALKNVKKYVIGVEALGSVLGEEVGQIAVICRTNLSLFNEAAKLCEQNERVKIGLVGGVHSYRFDQIMDIYRLFSLSDSERKKPEYQIKDKFIRCFPSISQLQRYADDVDDLDLLGMIQIVKTHHIKIPEHIERIKSRAVDDITQAEVVFTTAHKAKGLEFDTVKVTCDFLTETKNDNLPGFGGIPARLQMNANQPVDEFNLLYVALTRAKKRLKLTSPILKMLARLNETFSYPVSTKAITRNEEGVLVKCFQCSAEINSNTVLAFERLKVDLGYSTQANRPAGFLCSWCAGAENVGLSSLVSH
ncbi:F-box DNA helicase 1-like [Anneissia japonica]|uniref:F-box DNA helicase 1-like n=1 Tax=Anneissia japonica TaxID=1529436 RepID=UPI0014255097|nr:F-box DNA helicase 1-like [Anneissia japonica]